MSTVIIYSEIKSPEAVNIKLALPSLIFQVNAVPWWNPNLIDGIWFLLHLLLKFNQNIANTEMEWIQMHMNVQQHQIKSNH